MKGPWIARAVVSVSAAGLLFIQGFEGRKLEAYPDVANVWTICDGRTAGVKPGDRATDKQCDEWLLEDVDEHGKAVLRLINSPLTQGQFDALVSFTYNVGAGNLAKSTLRKKLNAGDCKGAGAEFKRWNRAGGRVVRGLVNRRAAEAAEFLKGCK